MKKNYLIFCIISFMVALSWEAPLIATEKLDRKYQLQNLAILEPIDDLDGVLNDFFREALKDIFEYGGRFQIKKIDQADAILKSAKKPYSEWIQDPEILKAIGEKYSLDILVRSNVKKKVNQYEFQIDLIHIPDLDLIATNSFLIAEPEKENKLHQDELKNSLKKSLKKVLTKIPFIGSVTGRDRQWITLTVGEEDGIFIGDQLVLSTVEEVRIHPLLKQIMEWNLKQIGRAEVIDVDRKIAFAVIHEEEEPEIIKNFVKVEKVIHKKNSDQALEAREITHLDFVNLDQSFKDQENEKTPKIGWVSVGPRLSSLSRTISGLQTSTHGTSAKEGGAWIYGFQVNSEIWLNQKFFFEGDYHYSFGSYSQSNLNTELQNISDLSIQKSGFRLGAGIQKATEFLENPLTAKASLGFRQVAFSSPLIVDRKPKKNEFLGSAKWSELADLKISLDWFYQSHFSFFTEFKFGLFSNYDEAQEIFGTAVSQSSLELALGAYGDFLDHFKHRERIFLENSTSDFQSRGLKTQDLGISFELQYLF